MITRYLEEEIRKDLEEKRVFLSGTSQVGKTSLAKSLLKNEADRYFNWDRREDRKEILSGRWPASRSTVVLDELDKYRRWKNWIKGEFEPKFPEVLLPMQMKTETGAYMPTSLKY